VRKGRRKKEEVGNPPECKTEKSNVLRKAGAEDPWQKGPHRGRRIKNDEGDSRKQTARDEKREKMGRYNRIRVFYVGALKKEASSS